MRAQTSATEPSSATHTRKEVGGFLAVGVAAVVLDFALFNGLMWLGWKVWAANAVALFLSMTFAFLGNYKWTFAHREIKSLVHAYSAFAGINLVAVVFIEAVVVLVEAVWSPGALWLNIAKAVATAIATVARFFAYKKWVFF